MEKCSKCNKKIGISFFISEQLTAPNFSTKNWNLYFCDVKCRDEWENSDCGKNYDLKRLEKLDEYLEKCKSGYKWSGGEPEEGEFVKRPDDEVYNFEEQENIYIEEAKKIRQKWNIKEENLPEPTEGEEKPPKETKRGLGTGAIIGIIAVILAVILGGVIYFIWQSKKDKDRAT